MGIKIRGIEVYYPSKVVDNNYYLEHFAKLGMDVKEFYATSGQNRRHIAEEGTETTITLAKQAVKRVLQKEKIKGTDIDLIIFTSQFPEYLTPTQAIQIHKYIKGKPDCISMDMNVNCVGMIVALDMINNLMASNKRINRALLIGADLCSKHMRTDSVVYGYMGDLGCAAIIERSHRNHIKDTIYTCNSANVQTVRYPICGLSNIYKPIDKNEKRTGFVGKGVVNSGDVGVENMYRLLKNNNLTPSDIQCFCVSQYAKGMCVHMQNKLGIDDYHMPYIGDEYGYTGTSSPFLVLYDMIKRGRVKRGDWVVLWSVGAGIQSYGILMKY